MTEKNYINQSENDNKRIKVSAHTARSFLANRMKDMLVDDNKKQDFVKENLPESSKRKADYFSSSDMDTSEWIPCDIDQEEQEIDGLSYYNDSDNDSVQYDIDYSSDESEYEEEQDVFNNGMCEIKFQS